MELDGFKDLEQQRQAREDFFEKSFDPTYIEKGKRGGTGEIRQWKDGKYQKQSDGTWKPVKGGGGKSSKEESKGKSGVSDREKYMQEHIYPEVESMMRSSGLSRKDAITAILEHKPYKKPSDSEKKEDPKKSEQVEDYDREWVESFMKKVRGAIKGVSLTPSRGDLSRDKKVKKIIRNMDDFPYYEMEVVKRELKKLGFDEDGNRI